MYSYSMCDKFNSVTLYLDDRSPYTLSSESLPQCVYFTLAYVVVFMVDPDSELILILDFQGFNILIPRTGTVAGQ